MHSNLILKMAIITLIAQNIRDDLGDEAALRALGESLKRGQRYPILVHRKTILDGHRRVAAAKLVGITELDAIEVDEAITPERQVEIQLELDITGKKLTAWEISAAVIAMSASNPKITSKDLAARIGMAEPLFSKHLKVHNLGPEAYEAYKSGEIGFTDAVIIASTTQQEQARLLAMKKTGATRDQIDAARKPRKSADPATRASKLKLHMPSGTVITVAGNELSLEDLLQEFADLLSEIKKAEKQNFDCKTLAAVLRDRAKASV